MPPTSFDIGFSLNPCPRKLGAPHDEWIANELDGYLLQRADDTWVATDNETVCGCIVVTGQAVPFLLVDVEEQRRGIGALLLKHAEDLIFRNHDEIRLECFVANDVANAFYARCGWTKADRYLDEKSGEEVWLFNKQKARGVAS